jgi:phosphate transport system substrate-binding protein
MPPSTTDDASTRRGLLAGGVALLGSLAGCGSLLGRDGDGTASSPTTGDGTAASVATGTDPRATAPTTPFSPTDTPVPELVVRASSVVYPVLADFAALWNANPAPAESGPWTPAAYGVEGAPRLADHFAARNGLEPTGEAGSPPVPVAVELTHSAAAARAVADDGFPRGDVAGLAEPSLRELPRRVADSLSGPALARAGHAFVVGAAVAEAGASALAVDALRDVYAGDVGNWRALGGPDRPVFAVAGPHGEGSATPLERFFRDGERRFALGGLDERAGPTELLGLVAGRDDAVALVPVGDAEAALRRDVVTTDGRSVDAGAVATPELVVEEDPIDLYAPAYPTTRDARLLTRGAPSARERAFLDALASPFGQREVLGRQLSLASVDEE